jgi:uncharacterized GH25 family protein
MRPRPHHMPEERSRPRIVLAVVSLLLCSVTSLRAHDFWIEPRSFRTTEGALIGLHLLVGENLTGDPIPRDAASIERFSVVRGGREQAVPGREGGDPAGVVRVEGSGLLVVAYQSRPHAVALTPATFERYLGEEGLDAIKAILPRTPARTGSYRERFSRCAKALIASGPQSVADHDRALGMPLELVASKNPYTMTAGQSLPVTLLYHGGPQPDALVIAINRDDPATKLSARTDPQGGVNFVLPRSGAWLIKAVHMLPATAGRDADWDSYWASLTFELPASPLEGRPADAR